MKNQQLSFLALIGAAVVGCTTATVNKDLVATGGSRSDGTVQLSYEQANYETRPCMKRAPHAQGDTAD